MSTTIPPSYEKNTIPQLLGWFLLCLIIQLMAGTRKYMKKMLKMMLQIAGLYDWSSMVGWYFSGTNHTIKNVGMLTQMMTSL